MAVCLCSLNREAEALSLHKKALAIREKDLGRNHIDFIPLGDLVETVKTLIQGSPEINFSYLHRTENGDVSLSCAEMREVLGDIPLNEPEILEWIGDNLREQYEDIKV